MMTYYFLETVKVDGKLRVRPLANQVLEDGGEINTAYNVMCEKEIREQYPEKTVFGAYNLKGSVTAAFYKASQLYVLTEEPKLDYHKPSIEMINAWENYKTRTAWDGVDNRAAKASGKKVDSTEKTDEDTTTILYQITHDIKYKCPTIKENGFYAKKEDWYLLMRNIKEGINTMIIGSCGSGKTSIAVLACKLLGIECNVYDMGSMYDPVAGLLGVHRLKKGGESIFDYAKFTKDIQKPGVIVLDELSRAPVTTNNILFPCLDDRRTLPVEIAGGEDLRSIKVHPECVFIATANVGSEYTGTMSMDRALVDRFFALELEYLQPNDEKELLIKRCGINSTQATLIINTAKDIRILYQKQQISVNISTRETLMVANLVKDGWSVLNAMELVLLPMYEGTKVEGEKSIIYKVFMKS